MRTLLHAFSTFSLGGAQSRFIQLANAYGSEFEHVIVAMDGNFSAASRLQTHVRWRPLDVKVVRGSGLANRRPFRTQLQRLKPDGLFTYNFGAIEWAAANWPRLGSHVHVEDGFGAQEAQAQLPRRVWTRRVVLGLGGGQLVVPSRTLASLVGGWWIPPARWRYIPNGVPVAADAHARRSPDPARPVTIGSVAGLRPEKNFARLIKACGNLKSRHDLRLVLMGDGTERAALERIAEASGLGSRMVFAGHVDSPRERLAELDLFALSSDTEQLPLALLDALAQGIPAVSTRVGDVPHVLPAVAHAALCDPDDAAFERTLDAVLNRRTEWPVWAEAGLAQVRAAYTEAQMLENWHQVFSGRLSALAAGPGDRAADSPIKPSSSALP